MNAQVSTPRGEDRRCPSRSDTSGRSCSPRRRRRTDGPICSPGTPPVCAFTITAQTFNLPAGGEHLLAGGNFHTAFIEELGGPLESEYIDEHVQLDLSVRYQLTPQLSLSVELQNLTDRPHRLCVGRSSRPIQQEYYEQSGRLSLQYRPF